jgi:Ca2+-transporting ATPase
VVSAADGLRLLGCGVLVALVTTGAFAWSLGRDGSLERARSLAFSVLVLAQLAVAFSFRSRTRTAFALGLLSNGKLLAAVGVALALQVVVLAWSPLREVFGTVLPGPGELGVAVSLALLPATLLELGKLLRGLRRSA